MIVTYDGSAFFGFQLQPGVPTVQGVLESAAEAALGEKTRVVGSGRTDTGVHALGQVAGLKIRCPIPVDKFIKAMNGILPQSVRVRSVEEAEAGFHPRFSATSKTYWYLIRMVKEPSPFLERFFCQIQGDLDLEAMRAGAELFVGEHDFSAFTKSPARFKDPVRKILQADLTREGEVITFAVTGTGFLHNMVRNMARALILIGKGELRPTELCELYRNQDRRRLGLPAPAGGLYLMRVMY